MKTAYFIITIFLFLSCNKEDRNGRCNTYLVIESTSTPRTSTVSSGITTIINGYGSNLCYSFSGTEIVQRPGKLYEIRLAGQVPCRATVCAEALLNVRDTITIATTETGQYLLQFYNASSLVKTDTVTVN